MSRSSEFVRFIPDFDINPDLGGSLVNVTNRDNEISYEAITSRKAVDFALTSDGFRALFYGLGVGAKYDEKGNLEAVRIEMLPFLKSLLAQDSVDEMSSTAIEEFLDLAEMMEDSDENYIAHLDLAKGKCFVYGNNREDEEKKKIYAAKNIENFDSTSFLEVGFADLTFYLSFDRFKDTFRVGIGMFDYEGGEISEIGNLPGATEPEEPEIAMLIMILSNDCNYLTYLDSKNANRFEKLAQRIVLA